MTSFQTTKLAPSCFINNGNARTQDASSQATASPSQQAPALRRTLLLQGGCHLAAFGRRGRGKPKGWSGPIGGTLPQHPRDCREAACISLRRAAYASWSSLPREWRTLGVHHKRGVNVRREPSASIPKDPDATCHRGNSSVADRLNVETEVPPREAEDRSAT